MTDIKKIDYKHRDIENQVFRLGSLLDVVVHLLPETSERFEYDDEILAVLFSAQDLTRSIYQQVCDDKQIGLGRAAVYLPDADCTLNSVIPLLLQNPKVLVGDDAEVV